MPSTPKRLAGPAFLASSATNIYTPADSDRYALISGLNFTNADSVPRTFSIYIGATGASTAGTQLISNKVLQAGETYTWFAPASKLRMDSTDFLVGICSAASAIAVVVMGEHVAN